MSLIALVLLLTAMPSPDPPPVRRIFMPKLTNAA
jgi:hypothetical protein